MRNRVRCKIGIVSATNGAISVGRQLCRKSFKFDSDQSKFSQLGFSLDPLQFMHVPLTFHHLHFVDSVWEQKALNTA